MGSQYYYSVEIRHPGLRKSKTIRANSKVELHQKVQDQEALWEEQWHRKLMLEEKRQIRETEQEIKRLQKELEQEELEEALEEVDRINQEANELHEGLQNVLDNNLTPMFIDSLKDKTEFAEVMPKCGKLLEEPKKPDRDDPRYNHKPPLSVKLIKSKLDEFLLKDQSLYEIDCAEWEKKCKVIQNKNRQTISRYNTAMEQWYSEKERVEGGRDEFNERLTNLYSGYQQGEIGAVKELVKIIINKTDFPLEHRLRSDVDYIEETKTIVADVYLPTVEDIPKLKSASYVKSKKEIKESYYSDAVLTREYDSAVYQLILSILYRVFSFDNQHDRLSAITVNGKIRTVNKATGKRIEPYVLSINITKESFEDLHLKEIDPKAWFKHSKGISAASIAKITPIAPIMKLSKEDSRFIDGYEVESQIDEGTNLAAMDWQDFENLIREVFEEEFRSSGGEVKITQASRDGGVDAVAFDPDPIRGGKIVIQAKRYTNVVGVSAVRDLYGTVLNEGAIKGILVTTSYYGNDAYEFAKGKPLTLLNGGNLLSLLEQHGHKARIDIAEAKKVLKDNAK